MKKLKWRSILLLGLIVLSIVTAATWLWSIILLFMVIPDLFSGKTYLAEPISRKETPVLYWAIIATWLFIAAYLLLDRFSPDLLPETWRSGQYDYYE